MRKYAFYLLPLLAVVTLSGCVSKQYATPSDITLKSAIIEVADALYAAHEDAAGRKRLGLLVDEATVEFNVAAKSTNKTTSGGEVGGVPLGVGGALKLSIANEAYAEGSRSNKITVKFKNIGTAALNPTGAALYERCLKNPAQDDCPVIYSRPPAKMQ